MLHNSQKDFIKRHIGPSEEDQLKMLKAKNDKFLYLTEAKSYQLPTPPQMHNKGNYIVSLSDFSKWLAEQAEALEIEIYPGFSASEVLSIRCSLAWVRTWIVTSSGMILFSIKYLQKL